MQDRDDVPPRADDSTWAEVLSRPLYGLPGSFPGLRALGDLERRSWDELVPDAAAAAQAWSIGLVHGNPLSGTDPYLEVYTSTSPGPAPCELLRREALRPNQRLGLDQLTGLAVAIAVDGTALPFTGVRSGDGWAVCADLPGLPVTLGVVGVRWPVDELQLVAVGDLGPYVEGRRWLAAALGTA